jgi:sRNA-binding regulator protein Hfq
MITFKNKYWSIKDGDTYFVQALNKRNALKLIYKVSISTENPDNSIEIIILGKNTKKREEIIFIANEPD